MVPCLIDYCGSCRRLVVKGGSRIHVSFFVRPMSSSCRLPMMFLTLYLSLFNLNCSYSRPHIAHSCTHKFVYFRHGWYWGSVTSSEAEELLAGQHDNVFLVRDSNDSRHILCVSFRCVGRTLHARLRHANGLFSLNNETFVPANRISEHCSAVDVKSHLFEMPVKLARPLNR